MIRRLTSFKSFSTVASSTIAPTYDVERTAGKQLPVYFDTNSTGHRKFTVVKNVVGDVDGLASELRKMLPNVVVTVRSPTKHIYIKGPFVRQTKEYLEKKGF